MFWSPVSSQGGTGLGGFPGPLSPRRPQDSQTVFVIGRRQDIPRETHLHAWVTPRCRLLLNSAGNRSWQPPEGGGAGFHGNPQLPHPDLEGKEGGRQK